MSDASYGEMAGVAQNQSTGGPSKKDPGVGRCDSAPPAPRCACRYTFLCASAAQAVALQLGATQETCIRAPGALIHRNPTSYKHIEAPF